MSIYDAISPDNLFVVLLFICSNLWNPYAVNFTYRWKCSIDFVLFCFVLLFFTVLLSVQQTAEGRTISLPLLVIETNFYIIDGKGQGTDNVVLTDDKLNYCTNNKLRTSCKIDREESKLFSVGYSIIYTIYKSSIYLKGSFVNNTTSIATLISSTLNNMFRRSDNRYQYSVPEKSVDSSALAAASALGRALHPDGKTVDHSKIPQYNQPSRSASVRNFHKARIPAQNAVDPSQRRHSSMTNNGRTKTITTTTTTTIRRPIENEKRQQVRTKSITNNKLQEPQSKTRSITKSQDLSQSRTRSITNKSHEQPHSQRIRNSTSTDNFREYHRSSSLPTKIPSNSNISRRQQSDASTVFADFDDPEFVDASDKIPVTRKFIKKYIPGPNGLMAVNVLVNEPINNGNGIPKKKSSRSSLRSSQSIGTNLDSHTSSNSLTNLSKPKSKIKRSSSMNQLPNNSNKIPVRTTHQHKSNDQLATHSKRASSLTNKIKNPRHTNIIETSMPEENESTPETIEPPKAKSSSKPSSRYNSLVKTKSKKSMTKSSVVEQQKVVHKKIKAAKSSSHLNKSKPNNRLSKTISEDFADFADDSLITNYDMVRPIVLDDEEDISVIKTDLSKNDSIEDEPVGTENKNKTVQHINKEPVTGVQSEIPIELEKKPVVETIKKVESPLTSKLSVSQQSENPGSKDIAPEMEHDTSTKACKTEIAPTLEEALQLLDDNIEENVLKYKDEVAENRESLEELNNYDTLVDETVTNDETAKIISSGTAVEQEAQPNVNKLPLESSNGEDDETTGDHSITMSIEPNIKKNPADTEEGKGSENGSQIKEELEEELEKGEIVPVEPEDIKITKLKDTKIIDEKEDGSKEDGSKENGEVAEIREDMQVETADVPATPSAMSMNEFHTPVAAHSNKVLTPMSNSSEYMSTEEDINLRNSVENIIDSMDAIDTELDESLNSPIGAQNSTFRSGKQVPSKLKTERNIAKKIIDKSIPVSQTSTNGNIGKTGNKAMNHKDSQSVQELPDPVKKSHNNLAQHLRSANPYLTIPPKSSKRLEDKKRHEQEKIQNERNEKAEIKAPIVKKDKGTVHSPMKNMLDVPQPKLAKVVTPIKSALKNNGAVRSNTSSVYSDYSPAEGAYLSLTTAENTRLNANIPETVSPPRRQNTTKRYARPQSMVARVQQRSSSPTTKEKTRLNRNSTIERRSSQIRNQPNALYANEPLSKSSISALHSVRAASMAVQPNGSQQNLSKSVKQAVQQPTTVRHKTVPPRTNVHRRESMIEKKQKKSAVDKTAINQTKAGGIDPNMVGVLYPREPPQKKSSFEKLRNSDSHLGFKMMSLRDEKMMNENPQQSEEQDVFQNDDNPQDVNVVSDLLRSGGWTSRFQDSDSDDDFHDKFSGSKSSSKVSSPTRDTKSKLTNGFSMFKSKSTADHQEQNHHSNYHVHPPYSGQQQQQKRSVSTPNNPSLTKVHNGNGYSMAVADNHVSSGQHYGPAISQQVIQNDRRVQSGTIPSGNPGRMSGRSLTKPARQEDHEKKQGSFGKKLKKIFGRKKTDI